VQAKGNQMNQVTIFGDIHGNLPALEAVLADMDQRELSPLYCLGDLVGYGTFPNEVIETIRERNIPTLMGNYDQGVGTVVTTAAVHTQAKWQKN
jgi:predicted phosphodiesterase